MNKLFSESSTDSKNQMILLKDHLKDENFNIMILDFWAAFFSRKNKENESNFD